MVKNLDIEEIERTQFSNEVRWAVRYGYQYRKVADNNNSFHSCLEDASNVLLWLGELVVGGLSYDLTKKYAKTLWEKLMTMKVELPSDVDTLLIEEDELKKFVKYVNEFSSKKSSATDKQVKYIREEIIADYVSESANEIWSKQKRLPTHEEWVTIYRDANSFADDLIS